jgi:hypothetical protein
MIWNSNKFCYNQQLILVYVVLCLGRGLATIWSPVQGVLSSVKENQWNWEMSPYAPEAGARGEGKRRLRELISDKGDSDNY